MFAAELPAFTRPHLATHCHSTTRLLSVCSLLINWLLDWPMDPCLDIYPESISGWDDDDDDEDTSAQSESHGRCIGEIQICLGILYHIFVKFPYFCWLGETKQIYSVEKLSKRLTARLNIGKVEGNIEKYLTSGRVLGSIDWHGGSEGSGEAVYLHPQRTQQLRPRQGPDYLATTASDLDNNL